MASGGELVSDFEADGEAQGFELADVGLELWGFSALFGGEFGRSAAWISVDCLQRGLRPRSLFGAGVHFGEALGDGAQLVRFEFGVGGEDAARIDLLAEAVELDSIERGVGVAGLALVAQNGVERGLGRFVSGGAGVFVISCHTRLDTSGRHSRRCGRHGRLDAGPPRSGAP